MTEPVTISFTVDESTPSGRMLADAVRSASGRTGVSIRGRDGLATALEAVIDGFPMERRLFPDTYCDVLADAALVFLAGRRRAGT